MSGKRLRIVGALRLALGEATVFEIEQKGRPAEAFLLRHETGLFAYLNVCPHFALDLDMGDGRFYAADVDRIYCKNHGALFRVADGLCEQGPCLGRSLEALSVEIDGEDAWVSWDGGP